VINRLPPALPSSFTRLFDRESLAPGACEYQEPAVKTGILADRLRRERLRRTVVPPTDISLNRTADVERL
jgi:hypothetical protein